MSQRKNVSSMGGLLLLNAALLAVLAAVTFAPSVDAQQARPRGDYTMVAGPVPGMDGSAVYIVDSINQEMMVVAFSQGEQRLEGVSYRHLGRDAATLVRGQQPSR